MAAAILPENFGYVVLTLVASGLLIQWQAVQVRSVAPGSIRR